MTDNRRQKLINQGAEALANGLLELAVSSEEAENLVERLMADRADNLSRIKVRIAGLKRSKRFMHYRESFGFAKELSMLLQTIKAVVTDPLEGVKIVARFYETDKSVFGRCDDSSGYLGDVYRIEAKNLFAEYASRCEKKEKAAAVLMKACMSNDYGVRDTLIDCAGGVFSAEILRKMIDDLQKSADKEADEDKKRSILYLVESLARQTGDALLFEKTRIACWGKLTTAAVIDIAEVYFETGEVETAHSWLKKLSENETFMADERDNLLLKIYREKGEKESLVELLEQKFRKHRSTLTLQSLLEVVGEEKRGDVLNSAIESILPSKIFNITDVSFLLAVGKVDEAEKYLLKCAEQFSGGFYDHLLPLAETMEEQKRFLAATMIYRSLLLDILERGYTKAYFYGVRYFRKLDKLAVNIADWNRFAKHETFKADLHQKHGRKSSFWSKYEEKK